MHHSLPPIAPPCFAGLLRTIAETQTQRGVGYARDMVRALLNEYERAASGLDAVYPPDKLDTFYRGMFGASRSETMQLLRYLRNREKELESAV